MIDQRDAVGRVRHGEARRRPRQAPPVRPRRRLRRRRLLDQPQARRVRVRSRAARGCSATSCAAPSRWPSIGSSSPTRCFSAPPCRCTGPSRRPTRSGFRPMCRGRLTTRPAPDTLLTSMQLTDRNGDGMLEDRNQTPVRFTIVTMKGRPRLERGVAVIRDELRKVGIAVDIVDARRHGRDRAHHVGEVRSRVLQRVPERHRSGQQPRFLAELREHAPVEHRAEDARHGVGGADRRS